MGNKRMGREFCWQTHDFNHWLGGCQSRPVDKPTSMAQFWQASAKPHAPKLSCRYAPGEIICHESGMRAPNETFSRGLETVFFSDGSAAYLQYPDIAVPLQRPFR